jgi:hypothetical protein
MANYLLDQTQQQYYNRRKEFTGDGATTIFQVSEALSAFPALVSQAMLAQVRVYINGSLLHSPFPAVTSQYSFGYTAIDGWHILFSGGNVPYGAPASGDTITFSWLADFGNYQFTSLDDVINQFMFAYVGESNIISKTKRNEVSFWAQRALQELSFDTFKSCKSQEIEVPPSLKMILPHDYVNYIKLTWVDDSGIERIIYPTSKTSNPFNPKQNTDGTFSFDIDGDGVDDVTDLIPEENSDTWDNYQSITPSENQDDYQDDTKWPHMGQRYGLDPQHAQINGSFFIDCLKGIIHFSSILSGQTVILHYISDSLGTDEEMQVHKFAEEAMYKWIAYGILSTRINTPEYIINRFKKEKFAETRKAKLRLSSIKLEEISQILRGKSKQIKH